MILKYKKVHPDAKMPRNAYGNDAGYDLYAVDEPVVHDTFLEYEVGIAIEPTEGYHTEVFPRGSIAKTDLVLANSVGLVDNGYRNTIKVLFKIVPRLTTNQDGNFIVANKTPVIYHKGDKIAQLVVRKTEEVKFELVEELTDSARGQGWLASSGQ